MNDDTREIIRAIERNTNAVNRLLNWMGIGILCIELILIIGFGCLHAKGATIVTTPIAAEQYWYTMQVPTDTGVYPMEVYAPALPALFADDAVGYVLGAPPLPPADVPEPGTWSLVVIGMAMFMRQSLAKIRQPLKTNEVS